MFILDVLLIQMLLQQPEEEDEVLTHYLRSQLFVERSIYLIEIVRGDLDAEDGDIYLLNRGRGF